MPKKKLKLYVTSLGQALETFDLKTFRSWVKEHNPGLYKSFIKSNETVQMAAMCKCICNRTDLLGKECHKKATKWLAEHNMRGQIW